MSLRKLIIMRHAERIDFTFGGYTGGWMASCFDEKGNYSRQNLNMPISIPKRIGGPSDYMKDTPLTRIGLYQATLTGEAMKECDLKFDHVFSSASLRCVETCTNVLKASNQAHLTINIEPGLFEWCGWYTSGMPVWMSLQEYRDAGFNVSLDYKPLISAMDLNMMETPEEYYMRSLLLSSKLLETYSGNLLFVGHAATLDTCSRQLTGRPPRKDLEFVKRVPYASVCIVEENPDKTWHLINPPFPTLKHCDNQSFDWQSVLS